jgi:hypothetical protein
LIVPVREMKKILHCIPVVILLTALGSCFGTGAASTSSARAAYGTPAPFKSHVRKNNKAKKKARKSGKRKRVKDPKQPYRMLPL